jgi:hypothetical protein
MYILRALAVWFVIIFTESIHGTLRVLFLEPKIGSFRARQIGVFIGVLLIFTITYLFINWINAKTTKSLIIIGLMWMTLTLLFEFCIGFVQGFTLDRMLSDYNIAQGGFMLFGILLLALAPLIVTKLRIFR